MTANGVKSIVLTLWHPNKSYCVPLVISRNLVVIANHWKYWVRYYGLSMYLQDSESNYIPVFQSDSLVDILARYRRTAVAPVRVFSAKTVLGLKVSLKNVAVVS